MATLTQPSATTPVSLLTATPSCPAEGWEFIGWFLDEDKESFEHVEFTDIMAADSAYIPDHDETHLYAVYKRNTNKYRILDYANQMVAGDRYLITAYGQSSNGSLSPTNPEYDPNYYDWEITANYSDNGSGAHLASIKGEAPQGAEGYYIEEDDQSAVWTMSGTYSSCTFLNGRWRAALGGIRGGHPRLVRRPVAPRSRRPDRKSVG